MPGGGIVNKMREQFHLDLLKPKVGLYSGLLVFEQGQHSSHFDSECEEVVHDVWKASPVAEKCNLL